MAGNSRRHRELAVQLALQQAVQLFRYAVAAMRSIGYQTSKNDPLSLRGKTEPIRNCFLFPHVISIGFHSLQVALCAVPEYAVCGAFLTCTFVLIRFFGIAGVDAPAKGAQQGWALWKWYEFQIVHELSTLTKNCAQLAAVLFPIFLDKQRGFSVFHLRTARFAKLRL